jgi:hypothetical protein
MVNRGPIAQLPNYYLFEMPASEHAHKRETLETALNGESDIVWAEIQVARKREKRTSV